MDPGRASGGATIRAGADDRVPVPSSDKPPTFAIPGEGRPTPPAKGRVRPLTVVWSATRSAINAISYVSPYFEQCDTSDKSQCHINCFFTKNEETLRTRWTKRFFES